MVDGTTRKTATRTGRAEVNTTVQVDQDTQVRGTVRIAPAVLIQLIETTVLDIPGVIALTARKKRKPDDDVEPSAGKAFDDGKVRVTVDGDQIDAEVSLSVRSGTNISRLGEQVREKVGVAAGRMLGMTVRTVDVYVDDIVPAAT
jgi:uncharacterized alkaline shock family protein YloU